MQLFRMKMSCTGEAPAPFQPSLCAPLSALCFPVGTCLFPGILYVGASASYMLLGVQWSFLEKSCLFSVTFDPALSALLGCPDAAVLVPRGVTEGVTLLLLAVQTGLLDMQALQRTFLLSIILFIVVTSTLQSMIEITDPVLLALGASRNRYLLF